MEHVLLGLAAIAVIVMMIGGMFILVLSFVMLGDWADRRPFAFIVTMLLLVGALVATMSWCLS